jgi:hypothetical protein
MFTVFKKLVLKAMLVVPFTKLYKIVRLAGASGILVPPYPITQ